MCILYDKIFIFQVLLLSYNSASFGSLECMEILVNLEGINLNVRNRIEKDTPLHKAVHYHDEKNIALAMVDLLLEAGADPR